MIEISFISLNTTTKQNNYIELAKIKFIKQIK